MGDYISREALKEAFDNADADVCESSPDGSCDWGFGRKNINDVIDGVPAADVEPVRRVRLAEREEQYVEEFGWFRWVSCLNCYSGFDITGHPRYCPYCGGKAVLDGENKGVTEAEAMAEIRATRANLEAASEMENSSVNFDDFFASYEETDQVDGNQTDPESDHMESEETTPQDSDGPEKEQNGRT